MKVLIESTVQSPKNLKSWSVFISGERHGWYSQDGSACPFLAGHQYDVEIKQKGEFKNIEMCKDQTPDVVGDAPVNTTPAQFKANKNQEEINWDEINLRKSDGMLFHRAIEESKLYCGLEELKGLKQKDAIEKSINTIRELYQNYRKLRIELINY